MTVSSTSSRVVYAGTGSTTSFPFAFKVNQPADLVVVHTDATGTDFVLSPSQYAATGFGLDAGGSVTYPLSGSPIAEPTKLTIYRDVAVTQPTSLSNQGAMWPQVIEAALDRLTFVAQKVTDAVSRSLVISPTDSAALTVLPNAKTRANSVLAFDGAGQPYAATLTASIVTVGSWVRTHVLEAMISGTTDFCLAVGAVAAAANNAVSGNNTFSGSNHFTGRVTIDNVAPTIQRLTSGSSATYTRPADVVRLHIRMWGGGGGGSGASSSGPTMVSGNDGGDTSFNGVVAKGGKGGGTVTATVGGAGGLGGVGTATLRLPGAPGGGGHSNTGDDRTPSGFGGGAGGGQGVGGNGGSCKYGWQCRHREHRRWRCRRVQQPGQQLQLIAWRRRERIRGVQHHQSVSHLHLYGRCRWQRRQLDQYRRHRRLRVDHRRGTLPLDATARTGETNMDYPVLTRRRTWRRRSCRTVSTVAATPCRRAWAIRRRCCTSLSRSTPSRRR